MAPEEEQSFTEDQLHLYLEQLGLNGNAHLSPPGKKRETKGWHALHIVTFHWILKYWKLATRFLGSYKFNEPRTMEAIGRK